MRTYAILLVTLVPLSVQAADAFALREGDRVVLIGSTLIEREQRYGYWETALTERYPGVTFRNLGWSGDTVFGTAQARFGPVAEGYDHRQEHVAIVKPTIILIGYGTNESFEGEAGLTKFLDGLNVLLDSLAPHKARLVLLSPLRHEDLGRPLPDPTAQNKNIRLYADALRQVAQKRGLAFVDLYDLLGDGTKAKPSARLYQGRDASDRLRLLACRRGTGRGAGAEAGTLEPGDQRRRQRPSRETGAKIDNLRHAPLRFDVTDTVLPSPTPPKDAPKGAVLPGSERVLKIQKMAAGKYVAEDRWQASGDRERG